MTLETWSPPRKVCHTHLLLRVKRSATNEMLHHLIEVEGVVSVLGQHVRKWRTVWEWSGILDDDDDGDDDDDCTSQSTLTNVNTIQVAELIV